MLEALYDYVLWFAGGFSDINVKRAINSDVCLLSLSRRAMLVVEG